jgi:hypothetical protein
MLHALKFVPAARRSPTIGNSMLGKLNNHTENLLGCMQSAALPAAQNE